MSATWKDIVGAVSPTLGTMLGGPLAGAVVKVLADTVLRDQGGYDGQTDEARLAAVLETQPLTPEARERILAAKSALDVELVRAGVRKAELEVDAQKVSAADADSARRAHAQTAGVLWLGYLINVASYGCVAAVLFGCYRLVSGGGLHLSPDVSVMLGSVVGGVVQWLMSNAQQANGFFFGSSPGSREMSRSLGDAVARVAGAPRGPGQ